MPEQHDPRWPSADEDTTSGERRAVEGDGGATAQLPFPEVGPGRTDELAVPNVTAEGPGSWFQPGASPTPRAAEPPQPDPSQSWKDRLAQEPPQGRPAPDAGHVRLDQSALDLQRLDRPSQQSPRVPRPPEPENADAPTQWSAWQHPGPPEDQRVEQGRSPADRPSRPQPVVPPNQAWPPEEPPAPEGPPQRPDWDQFDRQEAQERPARQEPPRRPDFRNPQAPPGRPPVPPAGQHVQPMRIEPTGEQYPAEATVGIERPEWAARPEQPSAAGDDREPPSEQAEAATEAAPEKPRRKRRALLIGAFALLVVVALGVAAAMPNVSNRLGLPWAPNAPKGDSPEPAAVVRVLHAPDTAGPAPTAAGVKSALSGPAASSALGTLTGSVVDAATGEVLWSKDPTKLLTPASTTKLLTSAAALLSLDHGLQLSTKIVAGAQPDTVVLVAGGDVTLTNEPLGKDSPLYPGAAHVDDLVAQVKKALGSGIKKVQLDISLYKGAVTAPGWDPTDAPSTFAAQLAPVMADGGRSKPDEDHAMRVTNPASTLATQIAQKLGAQFQNGTVTAAKDAKVLGEVKSPPLTEMVNSLLELSDNVAADAVGRQTALAGGAEASFAGAASATKDVLQKNGFDMSGVQLSDNSGLSKQNKVSAKLLSDILAVAAGPDGKDPRTAKLRPLLAGLPVAGGSGTLAERYGDASSKDAKGWVRAKTGALSGVNTLGGLVLDTDGRVLVFALMSQTGQFTAPDPVRAALDAIAAALRGCGCH